MSQPRLHQQLSLVFETKNTEEVSRLFAHPDFDTFMKKHALKIPHKELVEAFTHTSFSHEFNFPHQERLEFLGDAILQMVLTEELYKRFPGTKEGQLSKLRSALVNEDSLALMARGLGLGDLLIVGKGEFIKKLYLEATVLADTFEALLAQIYRHHGFEFVRTLILGWINEFIPNAFSENFLDQYDAKSKVQELSLKKYKKLPRYSSKDHGDRFEITLWINEVEILKGVFPSKKSGEKALAQEALKKDLI